MSRRDSLACLGALAAAASLATPMTLLAQTSDKTIKFILPVSAGSDVDGIARAAQNALSKALGQGIVIENQPGQAQLRLQRQ